MTAPTVQDPDARLTLVTGDDWAPWLINNVKVATNSLYLTYYMISPYWRGPTHVGLNLVETLTAAASRVPTCRLIIDQPNVAFTTRPFNVRAASTLHAAGWKIRVMPDRRTLHEKITIIDRRITLIGSHNISKASAISNYDASVAIESALFAELAHRHFWQLWRIAAPFEPETTTTET